MTEVARSNARGAAYSLAAFAVYSTHDVVVKLLGGSFAPFQIIFFSVMFGFPIVMFMLIRDPSSGTLRPAHPWWMALRVVSAMITGICVFFAFSTLPMAQTYAILFAAPLLITLLAIPILGEQVGWRRGLAVLMGLVGVLVVLQPGATELRLGHLAALIGAISSALASVIVRKIGNDERSAVLIVYPMIANFIVMGAILPFVYVPVEINHLGGFAAMALLGFCGALMQIWAYRTGSAVVVAPMQYSQIIWASIFGALIFSEIPDWNTAMGASIIIASGIYIVLREDSKAGTSKTPVLQTRSRVFTAGIIPRISSIQRLRKTRS
ncbi:DMT family transporter [Qingshengfaniella alkalisoli]|uniref:DMT family transporter n=1 Tax=Qingshengfaniella alkalisoli TaxID=2599296 RepID=A0A5B8J028_9RHOB|nr:DMT family transporter [Qingshengfaniella alkalisoli]QDY71264.1 DMT family transporter [Qingshengfaniella alkalisoli]